MAPIDFRPPEPDSYLITTWDFLHPGKLKDLVVMVTGETWEAICECFHRESYPMSEEKPAPIAISQQVEVTTPDGVLTEKVA